MDGGIGPRCLRSGIRPIRSVTKASHSFIIAEATPKAHTYLQNPVLETPRDHEESNDWIFRDLYAASNAQQSMTQRHGELLGIVLTYHTVIVRDCRPSSIVFASANCMAVETTQLEP